jgi:cell division protein FtsW
MRRHSLTSIDPLFLGLVVGLTLFGLAMLLSASGPVAYQAYSDPLYFVRRECMLGLLPGGLFFYILSRGDYRIFRKLAFPAFIVAVVLLILVFIPGLGLKLGGSHSWIRVGPYPLQPSEFVKCSFLIYAAAWMASRGEREGKTLQGGLAFLGSLGIVALLLIFQPDTGTMFVIALTALLMYFTAGAPLYWFMGFLGLGVGFLMLLIKFSTYRAARFMTFMHPELDPQGIGYHINQAFLAIGSGGWFGLGYGQSRQKYLYLPEVHSDSIIAIVAEELGFVMTVLFLCVLGLLVWRCFRIARDAPDRFGRYLAIGVGIWIGVQTFVNIASMTGLMPMTGVTLPFVSYGNSSTISLLAGLGLVASISRAGERSSLV